MHPTLHAKANPHHPAIIMAGSGDVVTYGELEERSNRGAHLLRSLCFQAGDVIALQLDNDARFYDIVWAAQRSGLYFVAISSKLTRDEVAYILKDSGAKLLVTSSAVAEAAGMTDWPECPAIRMMVRDVAGDWRSWDEEAAAMPATPIADERAGVEMLYSSGTTGFPKGIKCHLPADADIAWVTDLVRIAGGALGMNEQSIYLNPAPLYHAAPLRWTMTVHKLGGTVVLMEKFFPEEALAAIEKYKVTHSQWVPTHFVRMLKLSEEQRSAYDISSLRLAIHAAAPCPIPVKKAMIDWWGPIFVEYYAGSESNGLTLISTPDWLAHPGSVGKAVQSTVHIVGEDGEELPVGEIGHVYFEGGGTFEYHNDPVKTADARHPKGWTTLGDIGRLDEDGFLYLTDRKNFMIISGGVNIYPQEIENLLITHPKVADVAVIGAPDPEMGERVVAVVQPINWADVGPEFASELEAFARNSLSSVKVPKQIDFRQVLPRQDNGKLFKRLLVDEYKAAAQVEASA